MEGKEKEEDEGSNKAVREITLCRHIPASQPYVPADYVVVRQSFPAVVPWRKAFEDMSAELEWMVESWPTRKPEIKGDGRDGTDGRRGKVEEATKTASKTDFNNLGSLPWKPYREGGFEGWIFSSTRGAEHLAERLRKEKSVIIDGVTYILSGPESAPDLFIRRSKHSGQAQMAAEKTSG
jgi:hypothetical protein